MLKDLTAENIYIVCGHTDMRKPIDGLAAIVQQQYKLDLFQVVHFCSAEGAGTVLRSCCGKQTDFFCCTNDLRTGNSTGPEANRKSVT